MENIIKSSEYRKEVHNWIGRYKAANKLSATFNQNYSGDAPNVKFYNDVKILRREMIIGTDTEFLDANTLQLTGVSDIKQNQLPDTSVLLVGGIIFNFDHSASSGKVVSSTYKQDLIAEVRNATLVITHDRQDVFRYPVFLLANPSSSEGNSDVFKLDIPFLLAGGKDIKISFEWADGTNYTGTNKTYFEVGLVGTEATTA